MTARRLALGAVLAAVVAAIVFRSWVDAQARALLVLATTADVPVLTWVGERLSDEPRVFETQIAGQPTTVARPGGGDEWPALVFVNGATARGRFHPDVRALAHSLARGGWLVLVPDLPGLRKGQITVETQRAATAVARSVAARPDVRQGRVALFGVSVGATLALLAAEERALAGRISVVAGIAPFTDLVTIARLATTQRYIAHGRSFHWETEDFLELAVARSLAASLPPGRDRARLISAFRPIPNKARNPLAFMRAGRVPPLGRHGRAVVRLLVNRDPRRFERLYAALPASLRANLERLSPLRRAEHVDAPVELATAPRDTYFPVAESRAFVRRAPRGRLTVTRTLEHAVPALSLRDLADLARFDAFLVRSLRAARAR